MREILFRGRRIDNGEWQTGYLAGFGLITDGEPEDISRKFGWYHGQDVYVGLCEVVPETVGQFTGLTDKNGTKIFEGDIIGREDRNGETYAVGVVKYGTFNCSCCDGVYGWFIDGGDIRDIDYYEVIGNIHDNPELLGVTE